MYYTTALEEATFYGYTGVPCEGGFWVAGENGVRMFRNDGSQVYFSGGVELLGISGDLWLVELADGTTARHGRLQPRHSGGQLQLRHGHRHGSTYIFEAGSGKVYDSAGYFLGSGCTGTIIDGFMLCEDGSSTGWKSAGDEWVFRVPITGAD